MLVFYSSRQSVIKATGYILLITSILFSCDRPVGDNIPELLLLDVAMPPEYTVGGTVKGLLGSNLTLKNNEEVLNVNPSDSNPDTSDEFTFSETLRTLDRYHVTIQDHPRGPTQLCSLLEGTAT